MTTRDILIEGIQHLINRMLGTKPKKSEIRVIDFSDWDEFPNPKKGTIPHKIVFKYCYMQFHYELDAKGEEFLWLDRIGG